MGEGDASLHFTVGGGGVTLAKMLCGVQLQREVEEASECWRRKERVLERKAHAILHDILCLFEKTGRRRDRIEAETETEPG